jgi:hypothetical protein
MLQTGSLANFALVWGVCWQNCLGVCFHRSRLRVKAPKAFGETKLLPNPWLQNPSNQLKQNIIRRTEQNTHISCSGCSRLAMESNSEEPRGSINEAAESKPLHNGNWRAEASNDRLSGASCTSTPIKESKNCRGLRRRRAIVLRNKCFAEVPKSSQRPKLAPYQLSKNYGPPEPQDRR